MYVSTLTYDHELWVVTERMRSRIQMSFLRRVAWFSLSDRMRSLDIQGRLRVELPLLCGEEPVEIVQASGQDASWTSPWGGVSGLLIQVDMPEGLHLSTVLGMSHRPPGGVGGSGQEEQRLDLNPSCCPHDPTGKCMSKFVCFFCLF